MKINVIKFFRANNPNPVPIPKTNYIRKRFEMVCKGTKLDKFM